jgi:hypothetical protein
MTLDTDFEEQPYSPRRLTDSAGSMFSKFRFDDGSDPAAPDDLIEEVVAERSTLLIGGQSGAGKSFIMVELARCLATGEPFFGRMVTRRVGVAIIAAEGAEAMPKRLKALRMHYDIDGLLPIAHMGGVPDLLDEKARREMINGLKEVDAHFRAEYGVELGFVIIDTLAAAFGMKDENDNAEAGKVIRCLNQMRDELRVVVAATHHYGKGVETGLRGASAFRGNVDGVLSVLAERNEVTGAVGIRELNVAKQRDGREGPIAPFELKFIQLGTRMSGNPWGSMVVVPHLDEPTTLTVMMRKKRSEGSKSARMFEEAFVEAILSQGQFFKIALGQGPTVRAVRIVPDVREHFFNRYQTGADDPARTAEENENARYLAKKKAFQRAMNNHGPNFATEEVNGVEWIWKVDASSSGTSGTGGTL